MSDLVVLDGRGRPRVEASASLLMREERAVVKARVEDEGALDWDWEVDLERGMPYSEFEFDMFGGLLEVLE